jgi:EAL domain-containing protein (putative c-di-GMP-specific phosphodiesterase class I)/GGDEF domain-containing protein
MDFRSFHHLFSSKSSFGLLWFFLLSFPVNAAEKVFSYVEFNIAFVLGISVPVLIIAALMKPSAKSSLIFPVLLTFSLLGFLYSANYLSSVQVPASLSFAMIFVALLYVWPLTNILSKNHNDVEVSSGRAILYTINAFSLVFVLSLWFFPQVDAYFSWLVVNAILLVISLLRFNALKETSDKNSRYIVLFQWSLTNFFVLVMFAWLNTYLAFSSVVIFAILSYLIALINGNWSLISQLDRVVADSSSAAPRTDISEEELFSYTHDVATNLPTYQQALKFINHTLKNDNTKKLAIVVLKPINFQQVNSVLGHHNSDILLLQLAYCLQQNINKTEAESDIEHNSLLVFDDGNEPARIARLPGLHFMVALDLSQSSYDKKSMVKDLCRQLSVSVPDAMSFKSFSLSFELAFGIAFTGEDGNNISEVVAHATDALLMAETNQQSIQYYDHNNTLFTERQLSNMERLKQDIINDNLIWYLQPQINMNDKNIKGFELMGHWYKTADKPIELNEFLKIAELSGDIYELTKHMINQACRIIAQLASFGVSYSVSVNLSSKDLLEPELVNYIEQQLALNRIASKYLIIEFNESVILSMGERAKSLISQLNALGVSIAIDEFTGSYESLRYLRKTSINQVKISCKSLSNNEDDRVDKAIINALINLSRSMKLPLIGINIDNAAIGDLFLSMGGEVTQGYAVKHGVVIDELELWLEQWFKKNPNARPLR